MRIAGVNVGKVKAIERQEDTDAAIVMMEIQDKGLPIHKDAEVKIRPRIFLEGNFFVDSSRARRPRRRSTTATRCRSRRRHARAVRPDPRHPAEDTRKSLRDTLQGLGDGLTRKPSAADDRDGDPARAGESAAESLNDAIDHGEEALRGTAIVNEALPAR